MVKHKGTERGVLEISQATCIANCRRACSKENVKDAVIPKYNLPPQGPRHKHRIVPVKTQL